MQKINKEKLLRIIKNPAFFYAVISLLFCLNLIQTGVGHDDALWLKKMKDGTFSFLIEHAIDDYQSWSSRIIINTIALFFLKCGTVAFSLFVGFCVFLLQYSLYTIADPKIRKEIIPAASLFALLIPFNHYGDAGWIVTTCTYYTPAAFGVFSLISVAKICRGEKIRKWEYPLYSLALLYACNHEQQVVLYFLVYGAMFLYFRKSHRRSRYLTVQFLLVILSLVFILTCPGNYTRKDDEVHWLWDYGMNNFLDKIDLGYATAGCKLLYNNTLLVSIITLMAAVLIWKKYKNTALRIVGTIPFLCVLTNTMLGVKSLMASVDRSMFVTVSSITDPASLISRYFMYIFYTVFFVCFFLTFILIANTTAELVLYAGLIVGGLASRVMMGFSPTVFSSGDRTITAMYFSLVVCLMVSWSSAVSAGYFRKENISLLNKVFFVLTWVCVIDAALYIQ